MARPLRRPLRTPRHPRGHALIGRLARLLPVLGWAGLVWVSAWAQSADPAPAQRVEIQAAPASVTEQRRLDPVAKTVIGRDELDKYGDVSASDVLKRLPGVNMQGGNPRLRGLGAGYTLLLVNGEPAPPGFSLDNLSPSQIERIEITRGPSAEHSAQAVAGTLNIILREAPRSRQRELRATLGWQALRPTLSANGSWGDRSGALSYTLPVAVYQWAGQADTLSLRQGLGSDGLAQRLRVPGEDAYWGAGFNLAPRGTWKLDADDTLEAQAFVHRNEFHNRGRFVTEVQLGLAPASVDEQFSNGGHWQMARSNLQWRRKWPDGAKLELKAGGQVSGSRYRTLTDGLDGAGQPSLARDASGSSVDRSLSSGGKFSRPLGQAHSLALGWDLEQRVRREQRSVVENGAQQLAGYDGQRFEAHLRRAALFVQDEWEITPRWSTYLGLRGERIALLSRGLDDALDGRSQVLTPVWHLNHKLNAGGRDLVRASLTRSYKAPELNALLARPSPNTSYPLSGANTPIAPDRIGNPALRPELATGLDAALELYLPQGGVFSVGGFHRRIDGLIRQQITLQPVAWAALPRWVSQPVNLAAARSSGLEIELKGRADEWLPAGAAPPGLSLRASLAVYRSSVDGLPGPDNRLDQQQPWSATAGFDRQLTGLPSGQTLTLGASLAWTPAYRTQQTERQALTTARARSLDAYLLWSLDRQTSLRLAANNLLAQGSQTLTEVQPDSGALLSTANLRSNRRSINASWSAQF